MGPLWSGQGTVPHTTVSDLLSTDVLVSPLGALVEAELETINITESFSVILYLLMQLLKRIQLCCWC